MINALRTVSPFLSFKGLTHAKLVQKSITPNKCLTLLFFEDNDILSAKSAAQILSLNHFKEFKTKFSVFWKRKRKSKLTICSALCNCAFHMSVSLSAKEQKTYRAKNNFDDATFAMTSFRAEK